MRIVIFSGTTEGRLLSGELAKLGAEVLVSVATEYGKEEQGELPGVSVHSGRLDKDGMTALVAGADLCVDATHPYAAEVSKNLRLACGVAGVPLKRLLREESPLPEGCLTAENAAGAAALLQHTEGNILLTTGAKELPAFAPLGGERLYPRVLPLQGSLEACEAAGIPRSNILAMQGPFSEELNVAMIHQYRIRFLVTKDGGAAGGFAEKVRAAKQTDTRLLVIRRPADQGESYKQILKECRELITCSSC